MTPIHVTVWDETDGVGAPAVFVSALCVVYIFRRFSASAGSSVIVVSEPKLYGASVSRR